jgi:hypothetical protein
VVSAIHPFDTDEVRGSGIDEGADVKQVTEVKEEDKNEQSFD